jgi:trimeric autotransporter adhesin
MKKIMLPSVLLLFTIVVHAQVVSSRMKEVFKITTIVNTASQFNDPWEVTYGPDDSLWVTESKGFKLYKVHPVSGIKRVVLDLSKASTWLLPGDSTFNLQFTFSPSNPQGGFAGMAIHPDFNHPTTPKRYVYVSYIRSYVSTAPANAGVFYQNRIARFTFDPVTGKFMNGISVCDTLPGSSDHNSQRMIIAPVNGVNYLFYAAGDMGSGQFGNSNRPMKAQDTTAYEGKILRFNLEQVGTTGSALDKFIPNDNPYNYTGSVTGKSAVWAMGVRNNQGFAYDSIRNILYGSSHGPYSDDEINIIQKDKNYGHPLVIGYAADGNYDGSRAGTNGGTCPLITSEVINAAAIPNYKDPLFSGYAGAKDTVIKYYTSGANNGSWPSEAWSGLGLYDRSMIPGWKNSLVMAGLKWGRLIRIKLDNNGTAVVPTNGQDTVCYFDSDNRYRDMAFDKNGKDVYVIMDKSTATSGPSANNPSVVACAGCLQKFTFLGYNDNGTTSSIPSVIPIAQGKPNLCENANTININTDNNNLWVPITDTNSHVIAEINASGNTLGDVTTSFYTNTTGIRQQAGTNTLYLDRNIRITPQTQPNSTIKIRFYMTTAEFDALKNGNNTLGQPSGVSTISNVGVYRNGDACLSAISQTPVNLINSVTGTQATAGYFVQTNVAKTAFLTTGNSFYFANATSLLPINLIAFKAELKNNNVVNLKWATDNENITKTFIVERSINRKDYEQLAEVAVTNTTGKQSYTYNDENINKLQTTILYYRLKMMDAANTFTYSTVARITLTAVMGNVTVYPNPVINESLVSIFATATEKVNWQLIDNTGKIIMQQDVLIKKGENEIKIKLQKLITGIYYLKVTGNTINQTVKIQKL